MHELNTLETPKLIDMLAAYASDHSRMLSEGATEEEFARSSLMLRAIQAEIDSRKQNATNSFASYPASNAPKG